MGIHPLTRPKKEKAVFLSGKGTFEESGQSTDLRVWLLDPERRDYLIGLYKEGGKVKFPQRIWNEMSNQGLLETFADGIRGLSRKGRLLAYNIEEYKIQIESGKMFSVLERLNILPGSVVLDVGCGGGQTLCALADRHPSLALGMDFDLLNLEISQSITSVCSSENTSFAFQQGDGSFLPFKAGSIDVLICRGTVHYLHIRQALEEMARVLKPGGRIFIHALGIGSFMDLLVKSDSSGKLFAFFGILNGIFYALSGRQIAVRYRNHLVRVAFLTAKSLKSLEGFGIKVESLELVPPGFYVLVGEKR